MRERGPSQTRDVSCKEGAPGSATRRPPRPGSRALASGAPGGDTGAPGAELVAVADHLEHVIAEADPQKAKAPADADRGAARQRPGGDPADLQARHAGGLRNVRKSGPG